MFIAKAVAATLLAGSFGALATPPGDDAAYDKQRQALPALRRGPFTCAGAVVARNLASDLLAAVTDGARLEVRGGHGQPHVAGIITPPPFQLRRIPHQT